MPSTQTSKSKSQSSSLNDIAEENDDAPSNYTNLSIPIEEDFHKSFVELRYESFNYKEYKNEEWRNITSKSEIEFLINYL